MCYPAQTSGKSRSIKKCTFYGKDGHFFIFACVRKNYKKQIEQKLVSLEMQVN